MGLFNKTKNVDIFFVGCDGTDIDRGIYSFYLNTDNGELLKRSFVKSLANPISMSRHGRFMDITYRNGSGSASDGGVWQYACMDLQLGLAARASLKGKTYVMTCMNPSGQHSYAIDYYNGELVTLPIKNLKIVKISEDLVKLEGSGPDPIKQTESHPSCLRVTPDEKYLVVTDLGSDQVHVYTFGENEHPVEDESRSFSLTPGSGPKKLIFSEDGKFAYIMNDISSMINVYAYEDGHFNLIQEILSYFPEECRDPNNATDMDLSEDNRYLACTNKGDDTLVLFERDETTGMLDRVDAIETDPGPNICRIFKSRWIIVASKKTGTIESFEVRGNERRGILFETHSRMALHGAVCLEKGNANLRVVVR